MELFNDYSYCMDVQLVSDNCINCKRMDIDTISGEKFNMEPDGKGGMKSVPAGYENKLKCKYFDECKKIFEEGYKVVKDIPEPPVNPVIEEHKEDIEKIEKKPTTRKSRTTKPASSRGKIISMSPSAKKEREKKTETKTTKKAATKK